MIKVTLGEAKTQEEKLFPKLMVAKKLATYDEGIIVLFECEKSGVVLRTVPTSSKWIGYYSDSFVMDCFIDYNEPITIQNS